MNDTVPANLGGDLIFQPTDTLTKRVVEAEKDLDTTRRQRSRAVLWSIILGAMFLTSIGAAIGAMMWARSSVELANQKASTEIADARRELNEEIQKNRTMGTTLVALEEYTDIGKLQARWKVKRQEFETLRDYVKQAGGVETIEVPDPNDATRTIKKSVSIMQSYAPKPWTSNGSMDAENWTLRVENHLKRDLVSFDDGIKAGESWLHSRNIEVPKRNCVKTDYPFGDAPDNCS